VDFVPELQIVREENHRDVEAVVVMRNLADLDLHDFSPHPTLQEGSNTSAQ
jgi:hypothetical protein